MRFTRLALGLTLLAAAPGFGQTPASTSNPYGLDPYKPSDAAILREYAGALLAHTPLLELSKLDPYKPSHAELLRRLGGGLPLWGLPWYPWPAPAPLMPMQLTSLPAPVVLVLPRQMSEVPAEARSAPIAATPPPPSSIATLRRPDSNDGVWISYKGQKWISAGKTVPFEESAFVRVGEYGNFLVFRRAGVSEDLIYVPTREGMLAPYRLKPGLP
jgi:hypothetical protein